MLDSEWVSAKTLKLQTESAAGAALGCGLYFDGLWCHLSWPDKWSGSDILRDITFSELVLIALAVCLWKERFTARRIQFACDNLAVVQILNSKTAKTENVMILV